MGDIDLINQVPPSMQPLIHPNAQTGIRLIVPEGASPLLRILLPEQGMSSRGIEVEFPEHVWGRHRTSKAVEQLYRMAAGATKDASVSPALPGWRSEQYGFCYEMDLKDKVQMVARAKLEADGVRYTYEFCNHSAADYEYFQPVTCVKLYDDFSDTYLERTYVHHPEGFDLLASEIPHRLQMPLEEWLPCRYLVPFTWPIIPEDQRIEKEGEITRYHKSRRVDEPFIATFSRDGQWLAATYTPETGNVWTNPERTCQHSDPGTELRPRDTKRVELKTFLFQGTLEELMQKVKEERRRQVASRLTESEGEPPHSKVAGP